MVLVLRVYFCGGWIDPMATTGEHTRAKVMLREVQSEYSRTFLSRNSIPCTGSPTAIYFPRHNGPDVSGGLLPRARPCYTRT